MQNIYQLSNGYLLIVDIRFMCVSEENFYFECGIGMNVFCRSWINKKLRWPCSNYIYLELHRKNVFQKHLNPPRNEVVTLQIVILFVSL